MENQMVISDSICILNVILKPVLIFVAFDNQFNQKVTVISNVLFCSPIVLDFLTFIEPCPINFSFSLLAIPALSIRSSKTKSWFRSNFFKSFLWSFFALSTDLTVLIMLGSLFWVVRQNILRGINTSFTNLFTLPWTAALTLLFFLWQYNLSNGVCTAQNYGSHVPLPEYGNQSNGLQLILTDISKSSFIPLNKDLNSRSFFDNLWYK